MANQSQMISRVQSLCGSHNLATSTVVGSFLNSRHRDLLESHDWSRRKQDILIATQVDKSLGTVTVGNGSSAVAGSGTSWSASDVGRSLKIGSNDDSIFTVNSVGGAAALVLGDGAGNVFAYPGASQAGLSYLMFTQRYSLGPAVEQIIGVKYKVPLTETSEEFLDALDPSRTGIGDPIYFARCSRDMKATNDAVRIEIYPRPSEAVAINVKIERGHVDLSATDNPIVPSGPLQWLAAVDTCYFLKAKTKDDSWLGLAARFEKHGMTSLEFELNQDSKKFGKIQNVKDVNGGVGLSDSDFALSHDLGE